MRPSPKVGWAVSPPHVQGDHDLKQVSPGQLEAFGVVGDIDGKQTPLEVYNQQSLHPVGTDPWWVVGFHFVVGLNNILALGYPYLILVPLGWYAGTGLWIVGMVLAYYCNTLLASLHEYGGVRHIRHRDIAHHIYGPTMYKIVWFLQYGNLYVGDIGYLIVAGQALKSIYLLYTDEPTIQLAYWIAMTGVAFGSFAICVPNLHSLGVYSCISLGATAVYCGIAFVIAISNGLDSPPRDYSLQGTNATRIFGAIGAITTIGYSFNTTILPEIQSTVKPPTVKNTYKALRMQVYASNPVFMTLGIVGYWAYGSSVDPLLLKSLRGPKSWIAIANAAAFIQAIVSIQVRVHLPPLVSTRRKMCATLTWPFILHPWCRLSRMHGRTQFAAVSHSHLRAHGHHFWKNERGRLVNLQHDGAGFGTRSVYGKQRLPWSPVSTFWRLRDYHWSPVHLATGFRPRQPHVSHSRERSEQASKILALDAGLPH